MEVQEAERMHLSRELHDESGQILAALMVNLGLLERDAGSPELVRMPYFGELKRITTEVLDNLHALAVKLRPASLDHLGLVTALEQYVQEFNRQYNLNVQFERVGLDACRAAGRAGNSAVPHCPGIADQCGPARSGEPGGCALEPPEWLPGLHHRRQWHRVYSEPAGACQPARAVRHARAGRDVGGKADR